MREALAITQRRLDGLPRGHRALRVWLRLLSSATLIEKELRGRLRSDFDTTLPRFDVMAALARHPDGLGMSELSSWLMVSNGNVTGIVARLVDEGLVDRVRDAEDRRSIRVQLSDQGRREFASQSVAHETWVRELFSGLSAEDMDQLQSLLEKAKQSAAETD